MNDIVCWWSGGVTSAVACAKAIEIFGLNRCDIIMIDTENEHEDTYRFKSDCEKWYGKQIRAISFRDYRRFDYIDNINDLWVHHKSLNSATGAVCSTMLKRRVRELWERDNEYTHQVFGFEFDVRELKRAMGLSINYPNVKAIFPLLMFGLDKKACIDIIHENKIPVPITYFYGFGNNNCFKTGCVQGGIGYWQKIKRDFPDKFDAMANVEHKLTDLKGQPVTMLKDQSKKAVQNVKKQELSGNSLFSLSLILNTQN